jgi:hypothetical protein
MPLFKVHTWKKIVTQFGERGIVENMFWAFSSLLLMYKFTKKDTEQAYIDYCRVVDEISLSRNFAKYLFRISRNNFFISRNFCDKIKVFTG